MQEETIKESGLYSMTPEEAIKKLQYIAASSVFMDIKLACKIGIDAILMQIESEE